MKKQPVNIYFILYLAAIVILITDTKHSGNNVETPWQNTNIDLEFRLKPERPLLNCIIKADSLCNKLIALDSVNYILVYGNVSDIRYEFKVMDINTKNMVSFNDNDGGWFKTEQEDTQNRIKFIWQPNIKNLWNSSFIVYVTASAIVNNRERITAKTQFSLVVSDNRHSSDEIGNFVQILPDTTENNQIITTEQPTQINIYNEPLRNYSISPKELKIKAVAGQEWTNEIYIYGLSLKDELKNAPVVRIQNSPDNNKGSVYSPTITENSIILKGKAPTFGTSNVYISVIRAGDLKEVGTQFTIEPILYGSPNIPKIMYPGIEYNFASGLPKDLNNISIYIKENNEVVLQHFRTSDLTFSINNSDVGKQFSYERYINGQLIGQKYYITVADFPIPEITRVSNQSNNEIIVETISFGLYNNRENTIKELKITGNGKATKQHGKTRKNTEKLEFYEQFLITPIDKNKPFKFEAIAIDQRNRQSAIYK